MKVKYEKFNDIHRHRYFRDTMDVINRNKKTIKYGDIIFYFRKLKEIRLKYPSPELAPLFDPLNIYPFYYFMPFLFISDFHDKDLYLKEIRYAGIISTLIARRTILIDLFADEQFEQLKARNMEGLKKEHLGYYLQIIDLEINKIVSRVFPFTDKFYTLYENRFKEYINTMLAEKTTSPLIGMDESAFKKYAVGKSVLHLLVTDLVLHIIKKEKLTIHFNKMMEVFIMYLTLQDDVLDILEDIKEQQPSHFYPWISGGQIIEDFNESIEKAVILKFYLGGGVERCESLLDKYIEDIIIAANNINYPLDTWLEVINRMSLKTKAKIKKLKSVSKNINDFMLKID